MCLGVNNFFLGYISELGIAAAFEFSLGAFCISMFIKIIVALIEKKKTGSFFPYETSNYFKEDPVTGKSKIKWINVLGICLRPLCNMSF